MNKTKLTYADIEQLQHVLNAYVAEFHGEMGDSYKQSLENLKLKLIVVRAQMEQDKMEQN